MLPPVEEIKRRRKSMDLTQKQLAQLSGVSQSVIAKIESKKINPSYSIFKRIFDALVFLEKKDTQRAKHILSSKVAFITKKDPIKKAVSLMEKFGYSQLPVIDRDKVVGSVTEKLIVDLIASGEDPSEFLNKSIETVMEESFPRISEDTLLPTISALLQDNQAVLVTKREKTIGIITKSDLFKITRT